jgi:hypothetical protein
MSALELAQYAIMYARNCVPMKSDNKGYGMLQAPPPNKGASPALKMERNFAMQALKGMMPMPGCRMADVIAYGHKVTHHKAGNCLEQSAAATVYLSWQMKNGGFNLVYLASPGDHIFIVIGHAPEAAGRYPKSFAEWNEEAVVCDPWAKIACSAREYPRRWQEKLDKWAGRGLELPRKSDSGGGWMKANDRFWYQAPFEHDKLSYTAG